MEIHAPLPIHVLIYIIPWIIASIIYEYSWETDYSIFRAETFITQSWRIQCKNVAVPLLQTSVKQENI
jgi:hypothetical protein